MGPERPRCRVPVVGWTHRRCWCDGRGLAALRRLGRQRLGDDRRDRPQGRTAMADGVLGRRRQLAIADLLPVGQEDRVVAEPAAAVWLAEQPPPQYADLEMLAAVGQYERHGAAELGLALVVGYVGRLGQQQPVVGGVAYAAVRLREPRPAGRQDARHAVERVEADAGVVGE